MSTLLLYTIIAITILSSVILPWLGVVAYYTLGILAPQNIWFWVFRGTRIQYYIALTTMLGFILSFVQKKINFALLKDKQNLLMVILWISFAVSYYINPFGHNKNSSVALDSSYLLSLANRIFLFYFISILLIDNAQKLHWLVIVLLFSTIYYSYWANDMYLSGYWTGRLSGPSGGGGGIYANDNAFAALFVVGTPYLYYMGNYYKLKPLKYFLFAIIPFAWHSVFLTGSRSAFLGICVSSLFIVLKSRKKIQGILFVLFLVIAFLWQGGTVMQERSGTISQYHRDKSSEDRIAIWKVSIQIIKDHPITGVGIGNFMSAIAEYSDLKPLVAHNTFIQLAVECGLFAGVCYLLLVFNTLTSKKNTSDKFLLTIQDATSASMSGLFIHSMFHNFQMYELFYFLLIISFATKQIASKDGKYFILRS